MIHRQPYHFTAHALLLLLSLFLAFTNVLADPLDVSQSILREQSKPDSDGLLPHQNHDLEEVAGPNGLERAHERRPSRDGVTYYETDFAAFGRSIIGRAESGNIALTNNVPATATLTPDATNYYTFSVAQTLPNAETGRRAIPDWFNATDHALDESKLSKRQNQGSIYITVTTCLQPDFSAETADQVPQLTLFVSTSSQNQQPGSGGGAEEEQQSLVEGFVNYTVRSTTSDVYIGIRGQGTGVVSGSWTYEIAASLDQPYHVYSADLVQLGFMDTDRNAALLITNNISSIQPSGTETLDWLSSKAPMTVFVQSRALEGSLNGIRNSFCGLVNAAQIINSNSNSSITTNIVSYAQQPPQQQFHVPNLTASTTYTAIIVQPPNSTPGTPGGGGAIYNTTTFTTKSFANCQLLFNLTFCTDVSWAVPANPLKHDFTSLSSIYDNYVQSAYQGFNYSLQQIPCNTSPTAQYSLIKTCADCDRAYRTWLCAVSIPRCTDWMLPPTAAEYGLEYLMPRNAAQPPDTLLTPEISNVTNTTLLDWVGTNSSRNNAIVAGIVAPGPFLEVLPCADLCYDLVRSCPAALGFGCPTEGRGLEASYGLPGAGTEEQKALRPGWAPPTCNLPGALWGENLAVGRFVGAGWEVWSVMAWVGGVVVVMSL